MPLPSTSIKRPVTVTMFYLGIALISIYAFSRIGVDLLPNVNVPHLLVQTSYPDATPEEVEKLITEPLESAVGTVNGVKNISSVSKQGISVISVDFTWGTNMDYTMLAMREKLDNVRFILPREAERPTIIRINPSSTPILNLVLTYRGTNQNKINFVNYTSSENDIKKLIDLKEAARVIFKRRLEQIEGVAQAALTGGLEREVDVEIEPGKLTEYNLTYAEIANALKTSNINLPAGSILNGLFRYSLRATGEFKNIDDIKNTIIKRNENSGVIYLKDIANVKESFKDREGITRFNGNETVGLLIYKEPESNTVDISNRINKTVSELNKEYPDYHLAVVSDYSQFIVNAIQNVEQEIIYGGILAFFVLFFFLNNLRSVFIIGATIPASLALTVLMMYLFNINFNIVSLGGMALGVGMLLDNAIIVIENVIRLREEGYSLRDAAIKGSAEVEMPVVAATLTTIAVFLPLVFIKGIAGELFKDQSYAIVFSLSASIVTAITLIPMLASREKFKFINSGKYLRDDYLVIKSSNSNNFFGKIIFWLKLPFLFAVKSFLYASSYLFDKISKLFKRFFDRFFVRVNKFLDTTIIYYERLLQWALDNRVKVLFITLFLIAITIIAAVDMKKEFIPEGAGDEFIVQLEFPKGTSLEGNAETTSRIENEILKIKGVQSELANIGRVNEFDYLNRDQISIDKTNITVKLVSSDYYYTVQNELRNILRGMKTAKFSFQKVKTAYTQVLNSADNDIIIKVKNKNIDAAVSKAELIIKNIKASGLTDISDLRIGLESGEPEYQITIDREKCLAYGININDASNQLVNMVKGMNATYFTDFDKKIAVNIVSPPGDVNELKEILSYEVINGNEKIPLQNLVSYKLTNSYGEIWRENQARTVYIYANSNEGVDKAAAQLNEVINKTSRDPGEMIVVEGTNKEINESFSELYAALIISVLLMFIVLASEFESLLFPFIIIFSVPLGLIGGILILYIFGQSINIISIMGLIILVGIADNDAVVKVEYIIRKRQEGLPIREAIIEAGQQRFRPIVMNSFTVIFGLIPMMIGIGAGTQLRVSLSLAIAGGLVSSTFLTLIIIPVLYTYLEKYSRKKFETK